MAQQPFDRPEFQCLGARAGMQPIANPVRQNLCAVYTTLDWAWPGFPRRVPGAVQRSAAGVAPHLAGLVR